MLLVVRLFLASVLRTELINSTETSREGSVTRSAKSATAGNGTRTRRSWCVLFTVPFPLQADPDDRFHTQR
jgi:hypothetical protein